MTREEIACMSGLLPPGLLRLLGEEAASRDKGLPFDANNCAILRATRPVDANGASAFVR